MNLRKREVKYHCTYTKEGGDEIFHYHSRRIANVRNFIRANNNFIKSNKINILSCWKLTLTKNVSISERIFRNRTPDEPKDYYNNKIGA